MYNLPEKSAPGGRVYAMTATGEIEKRIWIGTAVSCRTVCGSIYFRGSGRVFIFRGAREGIYFRGAGESFFFQGGGGQGVFIFRWAREGII